MLYICASLRFELSCRFELWKTSSCLIFPKQTIYEFGSWKLFCDLIIVEKQGKRQKKKKFWFVICTFFSLKKIKTKGVNVVGLKQVAKTWVLLFESLKRKLLLWELLECTFSDEESLLSQLQFYLSQFFNSFKHQAFLFVTRNTVKKVFHILFNQIEIEFYIHCSYKNQEEITL